MSDFKWLPNANDYRDVKTRFKLLSVIGVINLLSFYVMINLIYHKECPGM